MESPRADPTGFLPRLPPEAYRGRAVVFWTYTVENRSTGWLDAGFHAAFREALLHASIREQLLCPVYTLMPDHLHLVLMGANARSDQRLATRFLREQLAPLLKPANWQHQPHDRVLREKEKMREAFANACRYVMENPVRAGLVRNASDWPFGGSLVAGYPVLHPARGDFWETFWGLYHCAIAQGALGKTAPQPAI